MRGRKRTSERVVLTNIKGFGGRQNVWAWSSSTENPKATGGTLAVAADPRTRDPALRVPMAVAGCPGTGRIRRLRMDDALCCEMWGR